jgi:hypothetical protein
MFLFVLPSMWRRLIAFAGTVSLPENKRQRPNTTVPLFTCIHFYTRHRFESGIVKFAKNVNELMVKYGNEDTGRVTGVCLPKGAAAFHYWYFACSRNLY